MGEAVIRKPLMSGHCANARFNHDATKMSAQGREAHARCAGGQRANPAHEFQPCPCPCHYPDPTDSKLELYDCGECGKIIIEAIRWPLDLDEDPRYTHRDWTLNDEGAVIGGGGRALGEDCYTAPRVSRNVEAEDKTRDCTRCGDEFTPNARERICPECIAVEQAEKDSEADAVMAELDEVLGDDDEFDAMMSEFDDLDED